MKNILREKCSDVLTVSSIKKDKTYNMTQSQCCKVTGHRGNHLFTGDQYKIEWENEDRIKENPIRLIEDIDVVLNKSLTNKDRKSLYNYEKLKKMDTTNLFK